MVANTGHLVVYWGHEKHGPVNLGGGAVVGIYENVPYGIPTVRNIRNQKHSQGCQQFFTTCFHGAPLHME